MMILWFPDTKWTPVHDGLADHPDSLPYKSYADRMQGLD